MTRRRHRALVRVVAQEVVRILDEKGMLRGVVTEASSRPSEGVAAWRDSKEENEHSDLTRTGDGRWRVVLVGADGRRVDSTFESETEARRVVAATQRRIAAARRSAVTVGEAIDQYEVMMRDEKKNRKTSWAETSRRLRLLFAAHVDLPAAMLTRARCERAYEVLRTEYLSPVTGRALADDSQMNILAEAKTFGAWLSERKMVSANPLAAIKAKGRRSHHGKTQLRLDEARRWTATAYGLADAGDDGAVAALMALLLGLRASEITARVVRDLDEGGAVLWVPTSKTKAGVRTVEVPDDLRPYLLEQAKGKGPSAPLFTGTGGRPHWRDWVRTNVARICRLAGVPKVCAHSMRRSRGSSLTASATIAPPIVAGSLAGPKWPWRGGT